MLFYKYPKPIPVPTFGGKQLNRNVEVKGKYAVLQGIFFPRRAHTSPAGLDLSLTEREVCARDARPEAEVGKFVFRFCFF